MSLKILELKINECYGCSACNQICTHDALLMTENEEGFLYPSINQDKCINCGLCDKVCPALNVLNKNFDTPVVYAAYNKDKETLCSSSSGGIFSIFAEYVFSNSGVVFGVVQNDDFSVVHKFAMNMLELQDMKGSKYVQSNVLNTYQEAKSFLKDGKLVLFTGTPCQIAGLRSFLRKDYSNLITCDLICHGVPSHKLLRDYCSKIKVDFNKQPKIIFRDTKVWNFLTRINYKNKSKIIFGRNDYFLKAFFKSYTYRESCYNCEFASVPRVGDISIGDFWGLNKDSVVFNNSGTSLILLNNQKAKVFFEHISSALNYEQRTLQEAIKSNKNIVQPSVRPIERNTFYLDHSMSVECINDKYSLSPTIRNYLGFSKRLLQKIFYSL